MIPKYPFIVERTYNVGKGSAPALERRTFEALPPCISCRDGWLRQPSTRTVRILAILDETQARGERNDQG